MKNYMEIKNTGTGIGVDSPKNQIRFFEYDLVLSCSSGEALFFGLSAAQQIAQTTTVRPAGSYLARNCGGGTTPGPDPEIPSDPNDQANETDIEYRQL